MDYIKKIEKNNVGLKTTLKEVFKDIDKRLQTISENKSTNEETSTKIQPDIIFELDEEYIISSDIFLNGIASYYNENDEEIGLTGETLDLNVIYADGNETNGTMIVQGDGSFEETITPLAIGEATITVSYKGNEIYKECSTTETTIIIDEPEENILTINNTPYTLAISNRDGSTIYFTLTDENQTTHTLNELGFSQNDSVACNNSNTNETIRGSLKVNDVTVTSWGFGDMCNEGKFNISSLPDNANPYEVGNYFEFTLTLTDENNDIISTATTSYIIQ